MRRFRKRAALLALKGVCFVWFPGRNDSFVDSYFIFLSRDQHSCGQTLSGVLFWCYDSIHHSDKHLFITGILHTSPANTRRWSSVISMLVQRRRRWTNIETALVQRLVFARNILWSWWTQYVVPILPSATLAQPGQTYCACRGWWLKADRLLMYLALRWTLGSVKTREALIPSQYIPHTLHQKYTRESLLCISDYMWLSRVQFTLMYNHY